MKDFDLHFSGHTAEIGMVIEVAKAFVEELERAGIEFEHSHFGSGHLLGGTRPNVKDINEENPAKFADGTTHPVLPEPVVPVDSEPEVPVEANVEVSG